MLNGSMGSATPVDLNNISFVGLAKVALCTHLHKPYGANIHPNLCTSLTTLQQ
jgi:hypothetical protein